MKIKQIAITVITVLALGQVVFMKVALILLVGYFGRALATELSHHMPLNAYLFIQLFNVSPLNNYLKNNNEETAGQDELTIIRGGKDMQVRWKFHPLVQSFPKGWLPGRSNRIKRHEAKATAMMKFSMPVAPKTSLPTYYFAFI
jgi:hypothetical protein